MAQIESSCKQVAAYDKLQAQVKIYPDSPSVPMQVRVFKYLSRVFLCPLKHICVDELSDEIQECIDKENSTETKSILIAQVVDNSNKYEGGTQRFSSHQPMQFYALGQDDCEERLILSGPVVFKNLLSETEAA